MLPMVIKSYDLSLTMASFLPFSFFLAYGIMSIPASAIVEKYGSKVALLLAFGLNLFGAGLFVLFPTYAIVLISLFTIGLGMAMLQVILFPLMRQAGGEEHLAFNQVLSQFVFGIASFISPFFLTWLIKVITDQQLQNVFVNAIRSVSHEGLAWSSMYFIFSIVFILMLIIISKTDIPRVELKEDEKTGTLEHYKTLLKNKYVILFFLGNIAYVGTEQGIANWICVFLETYHGISQEVGAIVVAWFWGLMTIGCLIGLLLVRLMDAKKMLRMFSYLALICISLALFGSAKVSLIAFASCGFAISIMNSVIISLAMNSVQSYHGALSGIMCTGIFGGALVPLIIGGLGDLIGLRSSMCFLYITIGYILSISYWAHPLIKNETMSLKEFLRLKKNK
jgi:fucose permease